MGGGGGGGGGGKRWKEEIKKTPHLLQAKKLKLKQKKIINWHACANVWFNSTKWQPSPS